MNLFIGNLSPETTEDNLRQLFGEYGNLLTVKIPIDNATGMPRGFGFVEMEDKFCAYDAIDNIDMTYLHGNIISVKESKPKTQGNNRPGGNRGGFNRNNNTRPGGGGSNYNSNRSYNSNGNSNSNTNRNYNSNTGPNSY